MAKGDGDDTALKAGLETCSPDMSLSKQIESYPSHLCSICFTVKEDDINGTNLEHGMED